MKKFILGVIVGLALPIIKVNYDYHQFAKTNPDDPRVIEHQEKYGTFKDDWKKFLRDVKYAWSQAKTDVDFKDIVRDIEKD